jgi:hypothetical protein
LKFSPGSKASSYTQLYTAFFLSGLIHILSFDVRPLCFYLAQAVAITLEDTVIAISRKHGWKDSLATRVLGYLWVYCTLVLTLGLWFDPMNIAGFNEYSETWLLGILSSKWL